LSHIGALLSKSILVGLFTCGVAFAHHTTEDVDPLTIDYNLFVEEVLQGLAVKTQKGLAVKTQREELFVVKTWRTMEPAEQITFLKAMTIMKKMCRTKAMFAHVSAIEAHTATQEQMLLNLDEVVVPQVRKGLMPHHQYVDFQRIVRDAVRRQPDPIDFGYENLKGCVRHGF
jgi:hypothetical protein